MKTLAMGLMGILLAGSTAVAGTSLNLSISGYLPAPPGVHIYYVDGRPCYREGGRVVYLKKDEGRHRGWRGHEGGGHKGRGHGHHGR